MEKNLPFKGITIKAPRYDLVIELRDPSLIQQYLENPRRAELIIQMYLESALSDISVPSHLEDIVLDMFKHFADEKLKLLEEALAQERGEYSKN